MPDSVTQILRSGPAGTKRNLVIVGDGYAAGDQDTYNDAVNKTVLEDVFGNDYFYEDKQAFNIYRINLISQDTGVTRTTFDDDGNVVDTTPRNTALDIVYSGRWDRCWIEHGPGTTTALNDALETWVDDWDFIMILVNEASFGGCRRGNKLYVTSGSPWPVTAHEFGHGFGALADEYCRPGTHTGGEPSQVNVTANSNRATLKWRNFVKPTTPVPTGVNPNPGNGACTHYNQGTRPAGWSSDQDVGLFEGGKYRDKGMYRPVENCRMRGNTPDFCPVCYTELKRIHHPMTGRTFEKVFTGDFNGDGRDDILVHTGNSIQLYRSGGSKLDLVFSAVGQVPGSWQFKPDDQFIVADFNGDGRDEVVVYNATDWNTEYFGVLADDGNDGLRLVKRYKDALPGWQFHKNDRFMVADFDGDGRKDLIVFNGSDWSTPYLGLLRSDGVGFEVAKRYDGTVEGWQMRKGDQHFVGDFSGDGSDDLYIFNGSDWSVRYLAMMRSTGSGFDYIKRYDNNVPGWQMAKGDRFHVGDFDGDGKADLYVFNGDDWNVAYLAMLRSDGASLTSVRRYDGNAPGWQMRSGDRHFVGDIDDNGRADLFVYNHADWNTQYLGTMVSSGNALSCSWRDDWVGEWNLGPSDRFEPCSYDGVGRRNLIVHNRDWLGMIRATPTLGLQRIYKNWIHNYRHGRNW